jgi:hypothetical protein
MVFYPGIHHPHIAHHFPRVMVSVNTLRRRRGPFDVNDWLMDSGAFTQILKHGGYTESPDAYIAEIIRWSTNGNPLAAVSQDMMVEPAMLERTGLTVEEHQRLTLERYDRIRDNTPTSVHILPVLQGYDPAEDVEHIRQYGDRLTPGMRVGVGSVCKRNGNRSAVGAVLGTSKTERPDLRLHGFGLKLTALGNENVRENLGSSDSIAWSFGAWKAGRDPNDWREAMSYVRRVEDRLVA